MKMGQKPKLYSQRNNMSKLGTTTNERNNQANMEATYRPALVSVKPLERDRQLVVWP